MAAEGPPVGVLLCADLRHREGLDPAGLEQDLARAGAASVALVEDLCEQPRRIAEALGPGEVSRLVLGLCANGVRRQEVQAWARSVGVDPFGVRCVSLHVATQEDSSRLLVGAFEGLRSVPDTDPERLRIRLPDEAVSRRALFSLRIIGYEPVAAADRATCAGVQRCGMCVRVCPADAVSALGATPVVDAGACFACGACVASCPTGAMRLPTVEGAEAEMTALLRTDGRGLVPSLLLACGRPAAGLDTTGPRPQWVLMEVPCLASVTAGWILQALAAGAPRVGILGCADECRAGRDANPVRQRIAYCHEILESLGVAGAAERVVLMPQDHRELTDALARRPPFPPLRPAAATGSVRLREPAATAEAIRVLADGLSPEGVVAGAGSPLGAVRVDKEACTVCGTCATVCPAAAFAYEQTFEDVTLLLDPGGCVACGTCVGACPEHAITVEQATDLRALRRGRTVVKRGAMRR